MRRNLPIAAALCLAAAGSAQTTWIVDPSGAGGAFTTIQAALTAASHRDTIVVHAGTYMESLQTSKGVMVACDPGVMLFNVLMPGIALTVTNVPAGETFTLRGLQTQLPTFGIFVRGCAGAVHLEDVKLPSGAQAIDVVTVEDCAQVTMTDCTLYGLPAVAARRSRLVLMGCSVKSAGFFAAVHGMTVDHSDVTVVGGQCAGSASFIGPAAPGIEMDGGTLVLAGRETVVAAGADQTGTPVPAIHALAGRIEIEPAVVLSSQNGAPGVTGSATVVTRRIPSVRGVGLTSGATWTLDLHAPTGDPFCLFAGLPQPPVATPFGELWFAPTAVVVLACGTVGPGDQVLVRLAMGALPPGVPLVVQGSVGLSSGLVLTTPSVNVTR